MSLALSANELVAIEWVSVCFNLAFTILLAYGLRVAWLCGFFGSLLGVILYHEYGMPGLTSLQVFFAAMGIYGFLTWGKVDNKNVKRVSLKTHGILIFSGLILVVMLAVPMQNFLGGSMPYHDAFITLFSVIANFLMAWKWLNHWLYWVVIDAVWLYVNIKLGLVPYSVLSALYIILSAYGYYKWRRDELPQLSP